MTDREIVEVSFLARMIYLIVISGMREDIAQKLHGDALAALEEPLTMLPEKKKNNLKRRVIRLEERFIKPLSNKTHSVKILLIAYYFINKLIDDDYINIPEESKLYKLINTLLNYVDQDIQGFQKIDKSAEKQSAKWLEKLQNEGYYKHV